MHVLYEINTEVWLREQRWAEGGEHPDLSDIPTEQLEQWRDAGIDALWFLGVWSKGRATREICLNSDSLLADFRERLPDFDDSDVEGSPFSIRAYEISPALGDERTLSRLRERLHEYGLKLILDFVPNHLAVDHPWVCDHPERFVRGTAGELDMEPSNWFRVPGCPDLILAHGRDPYFPGWTDTVQVNAFSPDARRAMIDLLVGVSDCCDGVRCDMAMLLLNDVFKRTWGDISALDYPDAEPPEFWSEAIAAVRARHPDFLFLAEVYWGLEEKLLGLGFDYTYDKTLYDFLVAGQGSEIRRHLFEKRDAIGHMIHFLENHDEARAARSLGPREPAAATLLSSLPGITFYHEGQFEGRHIRVPVQLNRRPYEEPDAALQRFYSRLFEVASDSAMRDGAFHLLYVRPAWDGNASHGAIVATMRCLGDNIRLIVVNVSDYQAQAWAEIPSGLFTCDLVVLEDRLGDAAYCRSVSELERTGLYLDMAAGECSIFEMYAAPAGAEADQY